MVTMIRSDLEFILQQILIAEADARGEQLLGTYLPNSEIPWGLRRVDGSNNNLISGQENYGQADQPFPRSTTPTWVNEGDDAMAFGPPLIEIAPGVRRPILPGETPTDFGFSAQGVPPGYFPLDNNLGPGGSDLPANWLNNNDYNVHILNNSTNPRAIQPGDVVDADPRTISNLIVDQTANNPAAIFKALQEAGLESPAAFALLDDFAAAVAAIKQARAAIDAANDLVVLRAEELADAQQALDEAIAAAGSIAATIQAYEDATAASAGLAAAANALDAATSDLVIALQTGFPAVQNPGDAGALQTAIDNAATLKGIIDTVVAALLSDTNVVGADLTTAQSLQTTVDGIVAALDAINLGDSNIDVFLDLVPGLAAEIAANNLGATATSLDAQLNNTLDNSLFDPDIAAAQAARDNAQTAFDDADAAANDPVLLASDDDAEAALQDLFDLHGLAIEPSTTSTDILKATLFIGNVAPDEGLSAPFNGWMTLFGQFFDHGLDLVAKGGWGSVYVPLQPDDPLYVEGGNTNFMVLTRSTLDPVTGEPVNLTTPFVDQNQTYTSNPSAQVFHREYEMRFNATLNYEVPVSTGRLLSGPDGSLATWAQVKAQALNLLGIELDDHDIHRIPELLVDPYGNFIPGTNGFPQIVTGFAGSTPITAGPTVESDGIGGTTILTTVAAVDALATGHAFLDDIAHNANPGAGEAADLDNAIGLTGSNNGFYDDELLDAHFITGDGRGNENIGLTAVHQVFHSEHNRQVGLVKGTLISDAIVQIDNGATAADAVAFLNAWLDADITETDLVQLRADLVAAQSDPDSLTWDGERIFQAAKFPTEMQYQHLVFEEFARKVQPLVNVFNDYNAQLNPAILAEFAHTVYRFGHSMLTETVDRLDANWNVIGAGGDTSASAEQIGLIQAFLNPIEFVDSGANAEEAAGNIIRGMTRQHGNEIDEFVTEALRNNLVGLPLDLATLNIARGRETGVPTLNEARAEFFAGSGDPAVKPYESWFEFAQNLKNPASVINFIAAYGTHQTILDAVNLEEKRNAATLLVLGDFDVDGDGNVDTAPSDRFEFLNHTGSYATDTNRGGLNDIDFWIGGLAEKKYIFGGFLGSTFNFVFETQLEALQDGDRFYYLSRLANLNMTAQLENNKFSEMIHRNTTATHLPGDAFALPNYFLEADISKQFNYGLGVGVDPTTADVPIDPFLGGMQGGGTAGLVLRSNVVGTTAGRLEYTGAEHVVLGGTDGNDHLIGGLGDDTLWGDAGDDRLEGGDGNDFIFGGLGNDIVEDEFGINEIRTNEGDDVVTVGTDFNLIITDTGRDAVFGGNGADEMLLGQDDDFADGGAGPDFMIGGEGNDWLESGTENGLMLGDNGDLVQGLPIKRSVDSRIVGHDVLVATGGNADFDAETGDDIMVGGLGTDRFFGQFGFDWATYKNDPFGIEADMNLRLFAPPALPSSPGAILDRYAQTEALSGSAFTDMLRGDDIADLAGGGGDAGAIVPGLDHALLDKNVSLIDGLDEFLGTIDEAGDNRFTAGNILMGGDGSDIIEGRGGNDLIDGDRWLNVRIARRDELGNEIETHDTLAGYKSRLISGEIKVAELHIVREVVSADGSDDVDAAEFSGLRSEYSIEGFDNVTANDVNGDGFITVSHDAGGAGLGVDGVDQLKNIERLIFSDQTVDIVDLTGINSLATGRPTFDRAPDSTITGDFRVGERLFANAGDPLNGGISDADGFDPNTVVYFWQVELVPGTGVFTNILSITADEFAPVTGPAFTLTAAEAGLNLRILARFQDGDGVIEQLVSLAAPIANADGVIPGAPVATDPAAVLGFDAGIDPATGLPIVGIDEDTGVPVGELPFTFTAVDLINGGTVAGQTDAAGNLLGITDPNGDPLTITNLAMRPIGQEIDPATGNLVDVFPGTLTFTTNALTGGLDTATFIPNPNFNGGITFTFDISDGTTTVFGEANLDVLPVNDAPTDIVALQGDAIAVLPAVGDVIANLATVDVDVNDGGAFALNGASANFDVRPNGEIRVVTALTNNFAENLSITATDDGGATVTETVRVRTGTNGNNTLGATANDDISFGLDGNDTLNGGAGTDLLYGGNGNDTMNGGAENDVLDGGAGDDTITMGAANGGRDIVIGGEGGETVGDTLVVNGTGAVEVFRVFSLAAATQAGLSGFAAGTDIVITRNTDGLLATNANIIAELDGIEEIVINTAGGADTVLAIGDFNPTDLAFNTIRVRSDNSDGTEDTIDDSELTSEHNLILDNAYGPPPSYGNDEDEDEDEDEDDSEYENQEDESCDVDDHSDSHQMGGSGDDEFEGTCADDFYEGGHGSDRIIGGDGDDELHGSAKNPIYLGDPDSGNPNYQDSADLIYGGNGNDFVGGNQGDDRLYGGKGDDYISGGFGNDFLSGGAGDDVLNGREDDDVLHGGKGQDTFVFYDLGEFDTILDFSQGEDRLDLTGVDGLSNLSQLIISSVGSDTVIDYGGSSILLQNFRGTLTEDDILL